jgi:hypothetical protein
MFHSENRKSIGRQLWELLNLARLTGYWPHNYFKYRAFENGFDADSLRPYIPGVLYDVIRSGTMNDPEYLCLVDNKLLSNIFLGNNGFPVTNMYGRFTKDFGFFDKRNRPLGVEQFFSDMAGNVIAKPVNSSVSGSAVREFKVLGDDAKNLVFDDRELSLSEFVSELKEGQWDEVLFEEKIKQHNLLAQVNPSSTNTIRIDTLREKNGEVLFLGAFFRCGRCGSHVDNWYQGGISVGVDIDTGALKNVGYDQAVRQFTAHPDSSVTFAEVVIPFWSEVVELARAVAQSLPNLNSIGWDIAIGERGPIIIEGNTDSGIYPIQLNAGPLMKNPRFVRVLQEYVNGSPFQRQYEKYLAGQY